MPMPRGKEWSEREDKALAKLWGTLPTTELAKRFGRWHGGVVRRAMQLGLIPMRPTRRKMREAKYGKV